MAVFDTRTIRRLMEKRKTLSSSDLVALQNIAKKTGNLSLLKTVAQMRAAAKSQK